MFSHRTSSARGKQRSCRPEAGTFTQVFNWRLDLWRNEGVSHQQCLRPARSRCLGTEMLRQHRNPYQHRDRSDNFREALLHEHVQIRENCRSLETLVWSMNVSDIKNSDGPTVACSFVLLSKNPLETWSCHPTARHGVQLFADVNVHTSCCSGEKCRGIRCSRASESWREQYFRATPTVWTFPKSALDMAFQH